MLLCTCCSDGGEEGRVGDKLCLGLPVLPGGRGGGDLGNSAS